MAYRLKRRYSWNVAFTSLPKVSRNWEQLKCIESVTLVNGSFACDVEIRFMIHEKSRFTFREINFHFDFKQNQTRSHGWFGFFFSTLMYVCLCVVTYVIQNVVWKWLIKYLPFLFDRLEYNVKWVKSFFSTVYDQEKFEWNKLLSMCHLI